MQSKITIHFPLSGSLWSLWRKGQQDQSHYAQISPSQSIFRVRFSLARESQWFNFHRHKCDFLFKRSARKSLIGSSLLSFCPSGSDLEISCASNSTWVPSKMLPVCAMQPPKESLPPSHPSRAYSEHMRARSLVCVCMCIHVSESLSKHIDTPYIAEVLENRFSTWL